MSSFVARVPDKSTHHKINIIAYRVTDIDAIVAKTRAEGYDLDGEIEDLLGSFRLAYMRGPEGLIVEVAEPLPSDSINH